MRHPEEQPLLLRRGDLLESTLVNKTYFRRIVVMSTQFVYFNKCPTDLLTR